jgi:excisionase family DNA binding protein
MTREQPETPARRESFPSPSRTSQSTALDAVIDVIVDAVVEKLAGRIGDVMTANGAPAEPWRGLVDAEGAAELLACSKRTIHNYVKMRGLACVRVGSRRLFDVDDLRDWARAHRVPADDALVRAEARAASRRPPAIPLHEPDSATGLDGHLSSKQEAPGR